MPHGTPESEQQAKGVYDFLGGGGRKANIAGSWTVTQHIPEVPHSKDKMSFSI